MTRRIVCLKCGVLKPLPVEDVAAGWQRRRLHIKLFNDLICDLCGSELPHGTEALAETMWREEDVPDSWETQYGSEC